MSLITPVHLAATNRLAEYLADVLPDVFVEPRWPDPDKKLPQKALTIIPAGARNLLFMDYPQLVSSEDLTPPNKIWRWRVAECEQPIQMDVWTQFPLDRDDIVARLDKYLNVGFSQLSNATVSTQPVEQNLVLELKDEWLGSNAYYTFDSAEYDDTPDQVIRQEYRATLRGMGYFNLTETSIRPQLAVAKIKIKLGENLQDINTYDEFDT